MNVGPKSFYVGILSLIGGFHTSLMRGSDSSGSYQKQPLHLGHIY